LGAGTPNAGMNARATPTTRERDPIDKRGERRRRSRGIVVVYFPELDPEAPYVYLHVHV